VADFCNNAGADVAYRNHDFHLKLTKGISYEYKDAEDNEKPFIFTHRLSKPREQCFFGVSISSVLLVKQTPS
jgi:type I restriction enzyme R subunit